MSAAISVPTRKKAVEELLKQEREAQRLRPPPSLDGKSQETSFARLVIQGMELEIERWDIFEIGHYLKREHYFNILLQVMTLFAQILSNSTHISF